MARPRNLVPTYRKHRTGRAVVSVYRADGSRTEILLPGRHGSAESKEAYERTLTQLRIGSGKLPKNKPASDITVAELVERYLREHATTHHRHADSTSTSEQASIVRAMKPWVRFVGTKPASEVTPLDLRAYRDTVILGNWRTPKEQKEHERRGKINPPCRRTVNAHVGRIRRMFRWGVSLCLVPVDVLTGLNALPGLQPGRSAAKDNPPVEPVPMEHVEKTIARAPEIIGDMIRVQLYSGCRAGELANARTIDIDQTGPAGCWILKPQRHKGTWRGHARNIVLGPKCQLILRRYLTPEEPERFLFRPCDTPYAKARPQLKFRDRYSVDVYDIAIARACERAGVPKWSSHKLRHLAARIAEQEIGLEFARQFLGHKGANLTALYAGLDVKAAAEVARKIG
jgi:integrase